MKVLASGKSLATSLNVVVFGTSRSITLQRKKRVRSESKSLLNEVHYLFFTVPEATALRYLTPKPSLTVVRLFEPILEFNPATAATDLAWVE